MSTRFNIDVIKKARIDPINSEEPDRSEISRLQHSLYTLQDENDRLKKEISVESQKARLIVPYANKVFWFCCCYTFAAISVLFLQGYESIPFNLPVSTLNYVAGTTLASVIGLIAIIAGGLFKSK